MISANISWKLSRQQCKTDSMILLVHHSPIPELRAWLEREADGLGGRLFSLPGSVAGSYLECPGGDEGADAAAARIRTREGVEDAVVLAWHESGQRTTRSECRCGGVAIGGGRITPIVRVYADAPKLIDTLVSARDAGAVLAWIHCGVPGFLAHRPAPAEIQELRMRTSMGIVVPVGSAADVQTYADSAAGLHLPSWHMQNEELQLALGSTDIPVFVSRHPGSSLEQWLAAAARISHHGNPRVVLVEEGRGSVPAPTTDIDITEIARLGHEGSWPLLVAPGSFGHRNDHLGRIALGAIAAGGDGIIFDLTANVGSDAAMQQFARMVLDVEVLEVPLERELVRPPSRHTRPSTDTSAMNLKRPVSDGSAAAGATASPPAGVATGDSGGLPVGFQGERGAYSEAAMLRYFGEQEVLPRPFASFHEVFVAVLERRIARGVVPLENSLAGSVHENYDHFMQFPDIKIVGEVQIRIEHSLIVQPGTRLEDIRRVFSHPQGLAQCSRFLQQYPAWERVPFYDTAGSVQYIAGEKEPGYAAIAGAGAAEVYGMQVLREGIENNPLNFTRFAVIAPAEEPDPVEQHKASMVFSTPDAPGALLRCLNILAASGLNLKKIESRPIFGRPWQYRFYVDVEMLPQQQGLAAALAALPKEAEDVRLIGTYPVHGQN